MKIKKGDTVIVTAGKDRGKSGVVLTAYPKKDQVLVEGMGMVTKHRKATRRGQAGQIIEHPTPLHISNVAVKDPKSGAPSRVRYTEKDGKKVRVAAKSGETI